MALTSEQKHYIRQNWETLGPDRIASDLGLASKTVLKYLQKHLPEKKYRKLIDQAGSRRSVPERQEDTAPGQDFNIQRFIQENTRYFVLFFFLVFVLYLNTFDNAFLSDDIPGVANNPALADFSHFFSKIYWGELPYFILAKLGLMSPFYFRAINIFFHFGSTCLIFVIFNLAFRRKNLALITALLFAIHPIMTESVTWISGRPYSQYLFFFLLSFLFYLLSRQQGGNRRLMFWLSFGAFFIALLTTEKAVALFAIFPLYEIAFGDWKKHWKKIVLFLLPTLLFAIIYASGSGQRISSLDAQSYDNSAGGLYNPLQQIPVAVGSYLSLIAWPDKLTLYHTEMSFGLVAFLLYLAASVALIVAIICSWKKNRFIFFWLSFFFISLTPTLTPLKISWIVAERYAYAGTLGIIAVAAYLLDWLWEKFPQRKTWLAAGFAVLIITLSVRTIVRNTDWDSEDTLWPATEKVSPSGYVIHNNMGDVHARHKEYDQAVAEFQKAIEINPHYADAMHNLGNTYQAMGRLDDAIASYQQALQYNPGLWQSYQNLAAIYFSRQDYQQARDMIEKALAINPTDQGLQQNLKQVEQKLAQ